MPIYEYYCPDNHTVYQFYAKTLAQGRSTPKCPANERFRMIRLVSSFAIQKGTASERTDLSEGRAASGAGAEDGRMEAAMQSMEHEFEGVDENDPRAMARMMRKMSELTGEKIDGEMEEVVRKLEEGADPESLEEQFGGEEGSGGPEEDSGRESNPTEDGTPAARRRARNRSHRPAPRRDPRLYDFD